MLVGHADDTKSRDLSILMNDVWVTDTLFSQWKLYNAGCFVQSKQFLPKKQQAVRVTDGCSARRAC